MSPAMGEKPTVFEVPTPEKRRAAAKEACDRLEQVTAMVTNQVIPQLDAAWTALAQTGMPAAVIGIRVRADALKLQARLFELLDLSYKAQEELVKK